MPPKHTNGNGRSGRGSPAAAAGGGGRTTGTVLPGPKQPHWGCKCGCATNWASRLACRQCGADAPRSISNKAHAAAQAQEQGRAQTKPQRKPQQQGARPAAGSPKPAGRKQTTDKPTFAEMVKRGGFLPSATSDAEEEASPGVGQEFSAQERYWRERRAAAVRGGEHTADDVVHCDTQLAELHRQAKAARPWAVRVQAATQRLEHAQAALAKANADLLAARAVAEAMGQAAVAAAEAEQAAAAELQEVRAEAARHDRMEAEPGGGVQQVLGSLRTAALLEGISLAEVAAVLLAEAARPPVPPPQPPNAATPPATPTPQPHAQGLAAATQVIVPASLLDAALDTQESQDSTTAGGAAGEAAHKGRRSRSRGGGRERAYDAASDAGRSRPR